MMAAAASADLTSTAGNDNSSEDDDEAEEGADAAVVLPQPPPTLLSPFGSYPNPLHIDDDDRKRFHPVVVFPVVRQQQQRQDDHGDDDDDDDSAVVVPDDDENGSGKSDSIRKHNNCYDVVPNIRVLDFTRPWKDEDGNEAKQLATEEERQLLITAAAAETTTTVAAAECDDGDDEERNCEAAAASTARGRIKQEREEGFYAVGRYDEDRVGLYESELFDVVAAAAQGSVGEQQEQQRRQRRTVHVGIDLDGPLGTPVYAFWDGTVHSAGYNAPLGDYGAVVVVRHVLPPVSQKEQQRRKQQQQHYETERVVYALYGHLDDVSSWKAGDVVRKGRVLGRMGDVHQNGGWYIPHVHFQVSTQPPRVPHDMPGTVTLADRPRALALYFDPRYVLGPLY